MSDEVLIKNIVEACENTLCKLVIADHMDVLNALTELMISTLKTAEYLSPSQAYLRAAEVFANAAVAEEAEAAAEAAAAEAKAAAAAAAKAQQPPARLISTQNKFERFQLRQQRVAQRAAKRARTEPKT